MKTLIKILVLLFMLKAESLYPQQIKKVEVVLTGYSKFKAGGKYKDFFKATHFKNKNKYNTSISGYLLNDPLKPFFAVLHPYGYYKEETFPNFEKVQKTNAIVSVREYQYNKIMYYVVEDIVIKE